MSAFSTGEVLPGDLIVAFIGSVGLAPNDGCMDCGRGFATGAVVLYVQNRNDDQGPLYLLHSGCAEFRQRSPFRFLSPKDHAALFILMWELFTP